jgi:hypothetical protein
LEGRQAPSVDPAAWSTEYLGPSLYGFQLERYLRYFEPSSIAIVHSAELRRDREKTMAALYEFLAVDPQWTGASDLADEYVSDERRQISPRAAPLKRSPVARRVARLMPASLRTAVRSAASVREPTGPDAVHGLRPQTPPIPDDMLMLLQADHELFVETASQCAVIGDDADPAHWWDDCMVPLPRPDRWASGELSVGRHTR